MKEKLKIQVLEFCNDNKIELITTRTMKKHSRTRTILSIYCKKCHRRFDIGFDTIQKQEYAGLCSQCSHNLRAQNKKNQAKSIVDKFEKYGYKVLTPQHKIKPRGKKNIYFTKLEIQDKFGNIYKTDYNNFYRNLAQYTQYNNEVYQEQAITNNKNAMQILKDFFDKQGIPYKQDFRFMDCKKKQFILPFDFCLFYNTSNKLLVELDGVQHLNKHYTELYKNTKIKNYYCAHNNIPLLRISYADVKNDNYQKQILSFLGNNLQY